jgi:hypothetical protein
MKRANFVFSILPLVCFVLTLLGCTKTDSLGLAGIADASAGSGGLTQAGGATALPVGGNELTQTGGATVRSGGGYSLAETGGTETGGAEMGGATASGGTGGTSSLLDMLPADNEVGAWVQTGGVELITDETALYARIDGGAPKYIDRGWVSSVYVNYSQGSRTIQVAIHDMGSAANAQSVYNYSLPPAPLAIPGLANAVVEMELSGAYAAYAYLDRFYIELNISEKDAAALTAIESFMSDIFSRIRRSHSGGGPDAGGAGAGGAGGTGGATGGRDGGPSCQYLTVNHFYPVPAFTFSVTLPDGSPQSCSMKLTNDGGSTVRYWPAPITSQISGWVTAVSGTELSVDTCEAGTGCSSNVYHFAVAAPGLTLTVPLGRLVSVWWWLYNGGWSCGQMLVISDSTSGTVARVWLAGSDSVVNQAFPAPFSVARQELFCNPNPSIGQGCGGNDVPPDDYAFQFTPQSANPPLVLATGETGTLDLTVGSGVLQHLTVHNLRSYQTLACDDYWNWAWWATGSGDATDGGADGGVNSAADDGTCPLLLPSVLAHYPSEADSPCPPVEPPSILSCPDSLAGVTCVYPSSLSPGVQDIWTCDKGLYANPWLEYQRTCKRTGQDCLVDADRPSGLSGARIQLTSSCASRPLVSCPVVSNDTAQTALDNVMRTIASNCLESTGATTGGALSVSFDGDCPTSFVVDPAELTDCIKAQLESERLDCASGLVCGASDYVGLGCGDCR